MPVTSYVANDTFVIRVVKSHVNNPDRKWANTYEFQSTGAGSEDELLALGLDVVQFEIALHLNIINFERLLISTWSPDSKPYNPEVFISSSLTGVGARANDTEAVGLHTCFSVTRQAATGRFGHIFFRGYLEEGQVSAPAGKTILANRVAVQTGLDAAIASSGIADYVGAAPSGAFRMVLINTAGTQIRPVVALRAQGVSTVSMDHKWFNRTGPGSL